MTASPTHPCTHVAYIFNGGGGGRMRICTYVDMYILICLGRYICARIYLSIDVYVDYVCMYVCMYVPSRDEDKVSIPLMCPFLRAVCPQV